MDKPGIVVVLSNLKIGAIAAYSQRIVHDSGAVVVTHKISHKITRS